MSLNALVKASDGEEKLGDLLRRLRRDARFSQKQLAVRSGLAVRTIRDLEGGRVCAPRRQSVHLLADALELVGHRREGFEAACGLRAAGPGVSRSRAQLVLAPPVGLQRSPRGQRAVERRAQVQVGVRARTNAWVVPGQVPMDIPVFSGRDRELKQLDDLREQVLTGRRGVAVASLSGLPGVGKTALAVHWAHRVRDCFPDGQLYVDLRNVSPGRGSGSTRRVLGRLLGALGVPGDEIPVTVDARISTYRSVLSGRRILVLLDGALDVQQVRALLPATPGCMVVVTSRIELMDLIAVEAARPVVVDPPSLRLARQLLATRIGYDRVAAEPTATDQILQRCGRLPLAIAHVASRLAVRPGLSLAALALELEASRGPRGGTGGPAGEIWTSAGWSTDALAPDAALVIGLFADQPDRELRPSAVATRVNLPESRVRAALVDLTRHHLLVEVSSWVFRAHDVVRVCGAPGSAG